jgi:hypothetical protein
MQSLALTTTTAAAADETLALPPQIKAKELKEFFALDARNQCRVALFLTKALPIIEAAVVRMEGYAAAANELCGKIKGASAVRVRVLYREYLNSGRDWRAFIDDALENKPASAIPAEFLDELQKRADANGRSRDMAIRMLRAEWLAGKRIPGYGSFNDWFPLAHPGRTLPRVPNEFPPGLSLRNLRRKLDPSAYRRTAQIQGLAAAAAHAPLVYKTRANLWPCSHVMFDDVWHDLFVTDRKQSGRPLEFFAHDVFTARKIAFGWRMRSEDDNGKAQGLTKKMTRMIVAAFLHTVGFSPRGTTLVVEHGTTGITTVKNLDITEDLAALIHQVTDGLVTVSRSGMLGAAAHAGLYGGASGGNSRHKASLEVSNKTVHALTAHLPGQTGTNRDKRPEQLGALLDYNAEICTAAAQLPAPLAQLLEFPLLSTEQFNRVLRELYTTLENFTDHRLEGWKAAGFVIPEMHILGSWMTPAEIRNLPPEEREFCEQMLKRGKCRTRERTLSRIEAWRMTAHDLIRITDGGIMCRLLGDEFATRRKVSNSRFEFSDAELGDGKHRYHNRVTSATGGEFELLDGSEFLMTVNPFAPDTAWLRDLSGRYIGSVEKILTADPAEVGSVERACGIAAKRHAELKAPLKARQIESARERTRLMEHNNRVLETAASTTRSGNAATLSTLATAATAKRKTREYTLKR